MQLKEVSQQNFIIASNIKDLLIIRDVNCTKVKTQFFLLEYVTVHMITDTFKK